MFRLQLSSMNVAFVSILLLSAVTLVCGQSFGFTVPANGDGNVTVQDNATYPFFFYTLDANETGLRFSLFSKVPENSGFQVNAATGQVYVDASKATLDPPLQYEVHSQYVLTVLLFDSNGFTTVTGTLTVIVEKVHRAPIFLTPTDDIIVISEGITLNEYIYTASATCLANNVDIGWSIVRVDPTGNGTLYAIDFRGGIYLINPDGQLNYTRVPEYIMLYTASDNQYNLTATSTLTIRVNPVNHPPVINNLPANVTIPPNIIAPTPFYFLSISDPEDYNGLAQQQGLYSYAISVNPIEGFSKFEISNEGTVSTVYNSIFNYTSQPYYLVTIFVTDWGSPLRTATGTLNVTITTSGSSWQWSGNTSSETTSTVTVTTETTTTTTDDTTTILAAVFGAVGGLMALGGAMAACLLCFKGQGNRGMVVGSTMMMNTNAKSSKKTIYEDEHVYFDGKAVSGNGGRSAIVSPFPGGIAKGGRF